MKRIRLILAVLAAVSLPALPEIERAAATEPAPAKKNVGVKVRKESLIANASAMVDELATGKFEQSVRRLDATLKPKLPAPKLQLLWQALEMEFGRFKQKGAIKTDQLAEHTIVLVPVVFGSTTVNVKIVFSGTNKVSGFFVEKQQEEAPYAQSRAFSEKPVKVGSGKWQLDGVLSLPRGRGPFPGVVLVHGSGAHDMDETVGPNKPFRDLAHGLASQGIAVIRYQKRTKQHAGLIDRTVIKNFTVKEETIDDALEAVRVLRNTGEVDKKAIVVLGHSLGGTLVPRIALADKNVSAFIIMAGMNEPAEDAIIRQMDYIASLKGQDQEAARMCAALKAQAGQIKKLTEADADSDIILIGAGPRYWLDAKAHDPLVDVTKIDRPVLFMQGGRDYQVTADGDFQRWRSAMKQAAKEAQCQFKLYPALNHLFFSGTGKCTPDEYKRPANVDAAVISDIVTWVKQLQ